jgi:hypothetical protein
MALLYDRDIAMIATVAELIMDQTASTERVTNAQDDIGAVTQTWATSIASLKCKLHPIRGEERTMSGSMGVECTHILFCGKSSDIIEADEVVIGTQRYKVTWVDSNSSLAYMKVELQERRPNR